MKSWRRSVSMPHNVTRSWPAIPAVEETPMPIRIASAWFALASAIVMSAAAAAEPRISRPGEYRGYSTPAFDGHQLTSRYVAARDGTRLAVDIFLPTQDGKVADGRFPVVWMHTPYNRRDTQGGLTAANYPGKALQLVKFGYVVAVADFRGTYASFGRNAGFNRGEWQDAARFDAYDITEWLAAQPWSNGKVGMWGCSATGGSQMQALSTAPPHLKAIFPMSCEWDVYSWVAVGSMTPPPGQPTQIMRGAPRAERDLKAVPVDADPDGALLRAAIAEHKDNLETPGVVPYRDSVSEAFGNAWWLKSSPSTYRDAINQSGIAVYAATNWAEGFTGYGPPFTFNNLRTPKKLILGPGRHCDWATVLEDTGFDIVVEELRFFDHWLRGIDNGVMREPPVTYYTYNETPSRAWKSSRTWPLKNERRTVLYFGEGTLDAKAPSGARGETRMKVNYGVDDASFWKSGMTFVTAPLDKDLEVTGHPVVRLWIASSSTDADVIARIDDVAADGTATYAGVEGKLRASMRALAKAPYENLGLPWHPGTESSRQPLVPNQPVELTFDLMPTSYLFKAGHRLRVTLQFADARATAKVDPAPDITVLFREGAASSIDLPVIPQ
jgi:predicted acyl esterase